MNNDLPSTGHDPGGPTVLHFSAIRTVDVYPQSHSRSDPRLIRSDRSTSWLVVMVLLLLVPPLGWLQIAHRSDINGRLRIAVAFVAFGIALAAWAGALNVYP